MKADLRERLARTMETDVRLLPVLPDLLADLRELGTSAALVVDVLGSLGVGAGADVLDLGCGKGAVAVALAERLGTSVEGVDAFAPFLEAAGGWAAERGVADRCVFREGDVVEQLRRDSAHDVVLLLGLGPVLGDHRATVEGLRRQARAGGHIVVADGFLAEGVERLEGYEGCAGHAETVRQLTAFGDTILREIVTPPEATRAENRGNTALIRRRATALRPRHPELADLIDAYVRRQEHETELLGRDFVCALWVLRRAD